MNKNAKRIVLFLLVGGSAAFINWVARIILSLWLQYELSVLLAYIIGMIVGYLGYRFLVYQASNSSTQTEIMRFIAVNVFSGVIVVGVASLLVRLILPFLGQNMFVAETGHAIAIALGAFINYHAHAHITFANKSNAKP